MSPQTARQAQAIPATPAAGAARLLMDALSEYITDTRIAFAHAGKTFFAGPAECPVEVTAEIVRPRFFDRVLAYGNLGLGEAYMDHDFEIVQGTLADFLLVLMRNQVDKKFRRTPQVVMRAVGTRLRDLVRGNHGNVQAHYDLPLELFEATLDPTMNYTCAHAEHPDTALDEIQLKKMDRICRKLQLRRGETLADVGFGFGGLMIFAAENYGVKCRGINVSKVQFAYAEKEIQRRGLTDRIELLFGDYKKLDGQYDKVVCVGLLEHLPRTEYRPFFKTIARLMKPGAFFLIQTVGCNALRNDHDPFTQKYIFPGSAQPRLSEIALGCERNKLFTIDVENKARHYHYTLAGWLKKFLSNRDRMAARFDEPFLRMWEYYLSGGMAMALASDSALWQVLITNDRAAQLPLVRV
jgi:cyclopropane-fatty-acyl-phospholipid synthase